MPPLTNLLRNLPLALDEELVEVLAENRHIRIERIVSTGQCSPESFWYDQEEHEWLVLLQGAARLMFDDQRTVELTPGDSLQIAAHCRHRVDWTTPDEPTVWLAVFYQEEV